MKRNTDSLPKFKGLAKELSLPRYATMGVLEAVWDLTGKHSPRGNVGKFSNQEIADDIGWEGDANTLIDALVKHRWLDTSGRYRLLVHDWKDHAPDWLKKAIARSSEGWASDADSSVCLPVADSGGQRQPVAASGGLPDLTLPCQTRPFQTLARPQSGSSEDHPKIVGRSAEYQSGESGRQAASVPDWLTRHHIDGPVARHVADTPGILTTLLDAAMARATGKVANLALIACYRICKKLKYPIPKGAKGTIDVSLQSILDMANARKQKVKV